MKPILEIINLSRFSLRERFLMFGSYFLVVLVLFNLVYFPKQKEVKRLTQRVQSLQTELHTLSMTLQDYQQKAIALPQHEGGLANNPQGQVVTQEDRISTVLRKVSTLAEEEKVELKGVRPEVMEEKERVLHLAVTIETSSRFNHLLQYLGKLETLSEPFNISDIHLETNVDISPYLTATIVANVLVWRES